MKVGFATCSCDFNRSWYNYRVTEILLQTKLNRPETRPFFVARPSLMQKLDNGRSGKLTLVSAPAGFGKTTLVAHWITSVNDTDPQAKFAWYALDEHDNDASLFLLYLLSVLQTTVSTATHSKIETIKGNATAFGQTTDLRPILTDLLNALQSEPTDLTLVLDDYHLITSGQVHTIVQTTLDYAPNNFHLVVLSRTGLPFPIARWRAQEMAHVIDADALRFNASETAVFYQQHPNLHLSETQIALITKQTEGWVACLQLAGLVLQNTKAPKQIEEMNQLLAHHTDIADYLMEEILCQQSAQRQLFLMQTAVLDRFSAPLCDAILRADGTSQAIIEQLRRDNLFIVSLDHKHEWFRYHHLFATFLRQQLQRRYPQKLKEIYDHAAAWFHQQELYAEAVQYALASGNFREYVALFNDASTHYLYQNNVLPAYRWFAQLPRSLILEELGLCVNQAWIFILSGEIDTAVPFVYQAEKLLEDLRPEYGERAGFQTAEGNVLLMRINVAYEKRMFDFVIENVPIALSLIGRDGGRLQAIAKNLLAMTYIHLQHYDEAERALKVAIQIGKRSQNHASLLAAVAALSRIYTQQGKLQRAKALNDEMLRLLAAYPEQTKRFVGDPLYSSLCRILYQWNDLQQVEQFLTGSIALQNPQMGYLQDYATQAQLQMAQGKKELAQQTLQTGLDAVEEASLLHLFIVTWQAQLQCQSGHLDAGLLDTAVSLSQQLKEEGQSSILHHRVKLLQARDAIASHKYGRACSILNEVQQHVRENSLRELWIETKLLLALANQRHATETAVIHLMDALKIAQPEGYVRLFIDEGEPMQIMLRQLANQNIMIDYVTQLLSHFPVSSPQTDLTLRELTTLKLFAANMPVNKIAEDMGVSPATIYTYSKRIYRKLDVHSRLEAVQKAKDLGLL